MAYRVLEVTLLSAKDLKKVNLLTRMEVYAVATISGDPITRQCTPPDPYGGRHPTWNATLRFAVPPTASSASGCLHVLLRTERSLGDRDVGEVIVPLSEVLAGACPGDLGPRPPQFAAYQVRKVHRTETRGVLHLSYRLGGVVAPQVEAAPQAIRADEPVVAYPVARPLHPQPYAYLPPTLLPPPPPSPRAVGHLAMPPPSPQGHLAMPPPSPHASGHVTMPPPPPPKPYGYLSMPPPPPIPASGHTAMPPPPPPKAPGHVSMPPPLPKAPVHVSMPPPTPPKASGHGSTPLPPPKASVHVSTPPPTPSPGAGYVATPPTPPKTSGYPASSPWPTAKYSDKVDFADEYAAPSPWPTAKKSSNVDYAAEYADSYPWSTAKNNGKSEFGMGLTAGLVGGMVAGDMMSDAAAYNAGYRAGLAAEWGKAAVY